MREMLKTLQIFKEKISGDEQWMDKLLQALPLYDAIETQWFVAEKEPHLYVEMFKLPAQSHYVALKKVRQSKVHPLFEKLVGFVEGGAEKNCCTAFQV